jgi:hypothetical protein
MTAEEWRPCFGGVYAVSNQGRVRRERPGARTRAGHYLKPFLRSGYPSVELFDGSGIRKPVRVHVLVAEAFIGPAPEGTEVNHKDGVKTNNCDANLEYVTRSGNCAHAQRLGLNHAPDNRKLSASAVREIRGRRSAGETLTALARVHGVSISTVRAAALGWTWRHA